MKIVCLKKYKLPDGEAKCGEPNVGPELLGLPNGGAFDGRNGSTRIEY